MEAVDEQRREAWEYQQHMQHVQHMQLQRMHMHHMHYQMMNVPPSSGTWVNAKDHKRRCAEDGGQSEDEDDEAGDNFNEGGDSRNDADNDEDARKSLKRAANRKSAQLSRQRKKKFIEDLSTEYTKLKVWQRSSRARKISVARALCLPL